MTEALVVLLLVWAGMLVPGVRRSRNASPHVTVGGFERAMDVLRSEARTAEQGRSVLVPGDAQRIVGRDAVAAEAVPRWRRSDGGAIARRRAWFERSLVLSGIMAVLAAAFGGWLWIPAGVVWVLSGSYVAVLRRLKLQRDEARQVVRDLELHRPVSGEAPRDAVVAADGTGGAGAWGDNGTVRLRRWDT